MHLGDWLSRKLGGNQVIPQDPISYHAIGVVRNRERSPRAHGWEDVKSDIILREELLEALDSIEGFSHVIVVFHMHDVPSREARNSVPVAGNDRGVLATRSQLRPNPIGVAVVLLLHRRKNVIRVRGLDAIDRTPVLDIKPYLPPYDSIPDARLPDWAVKG